MILLRRLLSPVVVVVAAVAVALAALAVLVVNSSNMNGAYPLSAVSAQIEGDVIISRDEPSEKFSYTQRGFGFHQKQLQARLRQ